MGPSYMANLRGRVLIADDILSTRMLIRTILTETGHTVVGEATTGREAVRLYHLFHPDVIVMDITMPEQDGLAAMEEILQVSPTAQVVVCTGMAFRKVAIEALRRGAGDFIIKPFRPETILQAVQGALQRAGVGVIPSTNGPVKNLRSIGKTAAAPVIPEPAAKPRRVPQSRRPRRVAPE